MVAHFLDNSTYKFLVLLPLEANEKIEVLKHSLGITFDNELVVRGIEIRRYDVPAFIKRLRSILQPLTPGTHDLHLTTSVSNPYYTFL